MTVLRLLPARFTNPQSVIICLHGVGADALTLRPIGKLLQSANPTNAVIIPNAPHASDLSAAGRDWFSVRGITDVNRANRISAALPWLEAFILAERRMMSLDVKQVAVQLRSMTLLKRNAEKVQVLCSSQSMANWLEWWL